MRTLPTITVNIRRRAMAIHNSTSPTHMNHNHRRRTARRFHIIHTNLIRNHSQLTQRRRRIRQHLQLSILSTSRILILISSHNQSLTARSTTRSQVIHVHTRQQTPNKNTNRHDGTSTNNLHTGSGQAPTATPHTTQKSQANTTTNQSAHRSRRVPGLRPTYAFASSVSRFTKSVLHPTQGSIPTDPLSSRRGPRTRRPLTSHTNPHRHAYHTLQHHP